jgi:hypothetical protein
MSVNYKIYIIITLGGLLPAIWGFLMVIAPL